jgi:hypothetical protein
MNKLYEVLETCLNEIEQGADVDTVLFRYPELADELRPILEASVKAKAMAAPAPSQEVIRRNRAKLLQHAAELRERKAVPASRRIWSLPLRRALVSLMVVVMLFVSGNGLVRASSNTLPGDDLYPVKRTWEDVLLFLTFDETEREALELEHEKERLDELHELFTEGRSVEVDFAGYVTRQSGDKWRVSGITVFVTSETRLPDQPVAIGSAVRVHGRIQDGGVLAGEVELLPAGSRLPEVEDDDLEIEQEKPEESQPEVEEEAGSGSVVEATVVPTVPSSTPEVEPEDISLEGPVTSVTNTLIVVNGVVMDTQFAEEIKGTPSVGAIAKVEGYYNASGIFIVVKIEFLSADSGGGTGNINSNDGDSNTNTNDGNSNDDVDNVNDDNDNSDDNSGSDNGDDGNSGGGDD